MTAAPKHCPIKRPMIDQNTSPPNTTAKAPVTIAVICKLAPNQSVNWANILPCLSFSGIKSILRFSTNPLFDVPVDESITLSLSFKSFSFIRIHFVQTNINMYIQAISKRSNGFGKSLL